MIRQAQSPKINKKNKVKYNQKKQWIAKKKSTQIKQQKKLIINNSQTNKNKIISIAKRISVMHPPFLFASFFPSLLST